MGFFSLSNGSEWHTLICHLSILRHRRSIARWLPSFELWYPLQSKLSFAVKLMHRLDSLNRINTYFSWCYMHNTNKYKLKWSFWRKLYSSFHHSKQRIKMLLAVKSNLQDVAQFSVVLRVVLIYFCLCIGYIGNLYCRRLS